LNRTSLSTFFHFGVRQKMVLVLLCVLVFALGANGFLTVRQQGQDVLREIKQRGEDISRFASQSVAFNVVGYDYHGIQLLLDEIIRSKDILYARVSSKKGNTMAEAGLKPSGTEGWVMIDREIVFDGDVVGHLNIGLDTARIAHQLQDQQYTMIWREALLIIIIAIGEFFAMSYIIVRPVSIISTSLSNTVDENGRIQTRIIPIHSRDEFGMLATQFNGMRSQLNEIHARLQSKIELGDAKLRETNSQLVNQSDELRRMNDELKRLSITDPLTGLYNRRQFERLIDTEVSMSLRHGEDNSILVVDVDHFKRINDQYGHKVGDTVLRRLAKLLTENLRGTDMVCRIGGEEFVAICRRAKTDDAIAIGEKLRRTIEDFSFNVNMERIPVTVSVGVATIPNEFEKISAEDFFHCADTALYYSKEHGRNRVTHYAHIAAEISSASRARVAGEST
jgi:diguanylate cyclase (GGDEF)-like protein